ncbi:MAG TPA: caspase family protein [Woeseiaceae bacterium]|nr:caspase family protein [Woeseiaceae bacterium]
MNDILRSARRSAALAVVAAFALLAAPTNASAEKRALIVTVSVYAEGTGWDPISSQRDEPLIRNALSRHGFTTIEHIAEAEATRAGIVAAFRQHLLEPARPGDVAVFHYSGHGHQVTDDGRDELDGYDEVLVPVDAAMRPPEGYTGDKHLRDDELGDLLHELRQKIGPTGDVLVFLDSCYSGTGTRGGGYPDPVRGTNEPIGDPARHDDRPLAADTASGIVDAAAATRGAGPDAPAGLAPMVVFSAEMHNRLAEETTDDAGERVGALSWTLGKALADAGAQTSYRDLFEAVKVNTAARHIPNQPQAESEGGLDRLLFAGQAVDQRPYFAITSMNLAEGWAELDGGSLVGLLPGSVVEVHGTGTRKPGEDTLIAKGAVSHSTPFVSEIELDEVVEPGAEAGWAFVTEQVFGSLRVNVYVDAPPGAGWKEPVVAALERDAARPRSFVGLLDARPDGLVADDATKIVLVHELAAGPPSQRGVMLETWESGQRLLGQPADPADALLGQLLIERIRSYARNAWLRALDLRADGMGVELELIPCELRCSSTASVCGGEECSCVSEGDPQDLFDEANNIVMPLGTGFGVRLKNVGSMPVYASVLDLMPDGNMGLLWPLPGTSNADTLIREGATYRVVDPRNRDELLVYRACPPFGTDMLKVIATTQPVDFGPITGGVRTRGGERGPLDVLFDESLSGTRGVSPSFAVGSVSTSAVTITVVEPEN